MKINWWCWHLFGWLFKRNRTLLLCDFLLFCDFLLRLFIFSFSSLLLLLCLVNFLWVCFLWGCVVFQSLNFDEVIFASVNIIEAKLHKKYKVRRATGMPVDYEWLKVTMKFLVKESKKDPDGKFRLRTAGSETSWLERAWVFRRKRTKSTELSRNFCRVFETFTGIASTTWQPSTLEETPPAGSKLHPNRCSLTPPFLLHHVCLQISFG